MKPVTYNDNDLRDMEKKLKKQTEVSKIIFDEFKDRVRHKLDKKHKIPKCKTCDKGTEFIVWIGNFRIGTYNGGIANYACSHCGNIVSVKIKPTRYAKKKYKKIYQISERLE